ncbi:MAG: serine/threonine-protein kinase [Rubripirellula sp.]
MPQLETSGDDSLSDPDALYAAKLLTQLFSQQAVSDIQVASTETLAQCGRFLLQRVLGRGAFGIVFEAFDPVMDRRVAIKLAHERVCLDESLRQRFFREIQLASKLNHTGIVRLYHAGEIEGRLYFTMEICQGETLTQWLLQQTNVASAETRDPQQVAHIVKKIAEAVHFGHCHGVIHRDLKPDNIVVDRDEQGEISTHVLDFGLAFGIEEAMRNTNSSAMLGTPLYMSPEQVLEESLSVGPASDIFSLGSILYECLTGVTPFAAETLPRVIDRLRSGVVEPPKSVNPGTPTDLETICMNCLAMEPGDRYSSAGALASDLDAYLNDCPIGAKPIGRWFRFANQMKQPLRFREFGVGLIAVNFLVLGWSVLNYPMAMFLYPEDPGDRVDHQMFLPMILLIIPIHSYLLWSSVQIYRRRLSRVGGLMHLLITLTIAVVAIAVICLVPSTATLEISRFQRVGALGLISTFAEVQAALVLALLYCGRWAKGTTPTKADDA